MSNLLHDIQAAVAYIRQRIPTPITTGLILGSGLGDFVNEITIDAEIPYEAIPNFPVSTVEGHSGKLIAGAIGDKKILAMSGRFHYYEGYSPQEVTLPVRVMKLLGVETLLLSNAAGAVNPSFKIGDIVLITDHIGLAIVNPLVGKNEDLFGTRFPDMSEPYSKVLTTKAREIGKQLGLELQSGVYFGVTGPSFETRAEYKMIHRMGADVVGMSTVQETIVAVHAGMRVFCASVVTDLGIREEENIITHEDVLQAARTAGPKLSALFKELVKAI